MVSGLIPKRLKNPSGFDESEFSGAFSASKCTNPTDEIRHSAHPRKVTNLLNNFRASIGPKSKTRIFIKERFFLAISTGNSGNPQLEGVKHFKKKLLVDTAMVNTPNQAVKKFKCLKKNLKKGVEL